MNRCRPACLWFRPSLTMTGGNSSTRYQTWSVARLRVAWKVQLGSFVPFFPPGCPSRRVFWPCHASYDLSVQELHTICDHSRHLCTLPHRPDVWTHHQAGDKRAQGQVEPGLPAEEMPAQCPVLYSPPLYSLPTPSCERRIKKGKKKKN